MIENNLKILKTKSNRSTLENWYKYHGIIYEKMELYRDFIISLFKLIEDTYMGSDLMDSEIDISNHFNWCFDTIVTNFEKENIKFNINGSHREYLYILCRTSIYEIYDVKKNEMICEFFYYLFNPLSLKKNMELSVLAEIYKIFEQNLKN